MEGGKTVKGKLICETETKEWTDYHLLDPKEFHNIVLPKKLGIEWKYLPRECLPNGEGVVYFPIGKFICAETITREDIGLFLNPYKCHREEIRRNSKIICETEKEKWEQYRCLNPDKLRNFLNPCGPRGDWSYVHRIGDPVHRGDPDEVFAYY